MRGYKIFGPDYKYHFNTFSTTTNTCIYQILENIIISGFRFYNHAIDSIDNDYYEYSPTNTYAIVEGEEIINNHNYKGVICKQLRIVKTLTYEEFGELLTGDIDDPFKKCSYVAGKLHGDYKKWRENGQLWVHAKYDNGKIDQFYRIWYSNGQLYEENNYKNGKIQTERKWRPDGKLWIEKLYNDNYCYNKEWDENGNQRVESTFCNGKIHGISYLWHRGVKSTSVWSHGRMITPEELDALQKLVCFRSRVRAIASCFNTTPRGFSRLLSFIKTREFNEWWYHPENVGGKRHKRLMNDWLKTSLGLTSE